LLRIHQSVSRSDDNIWKNPKIIESELMWLAALSCEDNIAFLVLIKKQLPIIKQDLVCVGRSGELLDFNSVPSQTLQEVCKRRRLLCVNLHTQNTPK
jgi:hypothetical protein